MDRFEAEQSNDKINHKAIIVIFHCRNVNVVLYMFSNGVAKFVNSVYILGTRA